MLIDFRQLFPRWNIKPKGVLHCGANIGEEAEVYHELGINKITWIEGNPETFSKLCLRMRSLPWYDVNDMTCLGFCVGDQRKKVKFNVSNNSSQSSSVLELGTHKTQHPDVHYTKSLELEMWPIKDIVGIERHTEGFDFLNMDLQGAELLALRGMGDMLHQFKWAYLEVNKAQVYEGCPHVNDLDLFMNGFGFKRAETHSWIGDWSDALYIKNGL